ncbi:MULTISPECIES: ABC transporter substrate-binding protein [unclassified Oleiphilus]|nr:MULTISPECIES: transporter substrate-binding domain-containing protein [unclassified Oleiphilus]
MSLSMGSFFALWFRRYFCLVLLIVTIPLPSLSLAETRECKTLRATGNPEYPPYLFRESEDNMKLVGANAEIMQLIAEKIGAEIDVSYTGPWSRAQKEVRDGRFDLLAGAFFTVPRAQYMDYVYPSFLTTKSVVWVNKEKPFDYKKREDLIGHTGATVIHNSFGEEFDEFAKASLDLNGVASLRQAFDMLVLGRVDYLLYENSPAQAYSRTWGVSDKVAVLGDGISAEGLYLTLSHSSSCNTGALRGKLTKALREIVESGQAEKALQKGLALWQKIHPQGDSLE